MNGHIEQVKKNISVIISSVILTVGLVFGAGVAWQKVSGTAYLEAASFTTYLETHKETHTQEKELLETKLEYLKEAIDRMEKLHNADHDRIN